MPIYDIFESKEPKSTPNSSVTIRKQDRFFSSLMARMLFLLLLVIDLGWMIYSTVLLSVGGLVRMLTLGRAAEETCMKRWMALKRSVVCGISLLVAVFSPALGIMIGCTYFLLYDPVGAQEVIPSSLQEQFQEFMK